MTTKTKLPVDTATLDFHGMSILLVREAGETTLYLTGVMPSLIAIEDDVDVIVTDDKVEFAVSTITP